MWQFHLLNGSIENPNLFFKSMTRISHSVLEKTTKAVIAVDLILLAEFDDTHHLKASGRKPVLLVKGNKPHPAPPLLLPFVPLLLPLVEVEQESLGIEGEEEPGQDGLNEEGYDRVLQELSAFLLNSHSFESALR